MIHLDFGGSSARKFIHGLDESGDSHVVVLPYEYHRDILAAYEKEHNISLSEVHGGHIEKTEDGYALFGSSESFGSASLSDVQSILSQAGYAAQIDSELDRAMKAEIAKFTSYTAKFDDPFMTEAIARVRDNSILCCFDAIKSPQRVDNGLATMVFATENGGSFGFDTLWVVAEQGIDIVAKPVIINRWYINNVRPERKGDVCSIRYFADSREQSIDVHIPSLDDVVPVSTLNPAEEMLRNMYEENMQRIQASGGPVAINARLEKKRTLYPEGKAAYAECLNSRGDCSPQFQLSYL